MNLAGMESRAFLTANVMNKEPFNSYSRLRNGENRNVDYSNSLLRGVLIGIPLALCGFLVPVLIGVGLSLLRSEPMDAISSSWFTDCIAESIALSLVCFLAAVLNYSPAQRIGFLWCVLFVGISGVVGVVVVNVGVYLLFERHNFPALSVIIVVEALIPIAYALIHTFIRFRIAY